MGLVRASDNSCNNAVEYHRGELFPRVGFIVTNMTLPSRSVV